MDEVYEAVLANPAAPGWAGHTYPAKCQPFRKRATDGEERGPGNKHRKSR